MNCPVCNKSGLPNFRSEPVVCPQCNSDLKGYMVLEKTNKTHKTTIRKQRNLSVVAIFLIFIIAVVFILTSKQKSTLSVPVTTKQDSTINILQTRVLNQEQKIKELQTSNLNKQSADYKYVVKNGDNLSKLAYIFYNDWREFTRIEKDNNLTSGELIHPGDTLIIKLND